MIMPKATPVLSILPKAYFGFVNFAEGDLTSTKEA